MAHPGSPTSHRLQISWAAAPHCLARSAGPRQGAVERGQSRGTAYRVSCGMGFRSRIEAQFAKPLAGSRSGSASRLHAEQNGQLTLRGNGRLTRKRPLELRGNSCLARCELGADCRSAAFGCGGSIPSLPTDFREPACARGPSTLEGLYRFFVREALTVV